MKKHNICFLKLQNLEINKSISHSFLSAAPVEEGLKFLILTSVIAKFKDYDDAVDGIVYCVCLSQGFAAGKIIAIPHKKDFIIVSFGSGNRSLLIK